MIIKRNKKEKQKPLEKKVQITANTIHPIDRDLGVLYTNKDFEAINPKMFGGNVVLGDIANAISVGMPNKGIFDSYRSVLDTQGVILKSVNDAQRIISPMVGELNATADRINSILSPITGAVLDMGLNIANANKLFDNGLIAKSKFLDLQKISEISFDTLKEGQNYLLSNLEKGNSVKSLITDSSLYSIPMTATGLDMMTRSVPTFPLGVDLPVLETIRKNYFLDETEIGIEHDKLDDALKRINPELVSIRRGCWKTFNAKGSDYIRQASSSMRGLVDDLLREIAPDKFPTRKNRIYYAVDYESKKAVHLERMTKAFLETYDNLSAWDHKPTKNDEFVRGVFIAIEGYVISLLSEKRKES